MKRHPLLNLRTLLAASLALISSAVLAAPTVGKPAPAFSARDSQGNTVQLADFAGRFVVLEWTNDGCPFVQKHYQGNMQSLQKEAADRNVAWLTVISSAPGQQGHVDGAGADQLTLARGAMPSAVLLDESGAVGHLYGAKTTPHMFIINPQGVLIYAGGIDSIPTASVEDLARARPYVKTALAQALAGEPVKEAVTRPYGCAIKYQ